MIRLELVFARRTGIPRRGSGKTDAEWPDGLMVPKQFDSLAFNTIVADARIVGFAGL